jgi:hypothetical protein
VVTGISLAVIFGLAFLVYRVRKRRAIRAFNPDLHIVNEFHDEEFGIPPPSSGMTTTTSIASFPPTTTTSEVAAIGDNWRRPVVKYDKLKLVEHMEHQQPK